MGLHHYTTQLSHPIQLSACVFVLWNIVIILKYLALFDIAVFIRWNSFINNLAHMSHNIQYSSIYDSKTTISLFTQVWASFIYFSWFQWKQSDRIITGTSLMSFVIWLAQHIATVIIFLHWYKKGFNGPPSWYNT